MSPQWRHVRRTPCQRFWNDTDMLSLSVNSINETSPYKVENSGEGSFMFVTDHGVKYEVSFIVDYTLDLENIYQFCIDNVENKQQPRDVKVRDTVIAIIGEFFKNNHLCMLYICDTSDGRQSARHRIFSLWFSEAGAKDIYTYLPAHIQVEGIDYFASLILSRQHPEYDKIATTFRNFEEDLKLKWS